MKRQETEQNSIDTLFTQLNEKANLVFQFTTLYSDYAAVHHTFGPGQQVNTVEVHTLTAIEENPGITVTQLAEMWHRTNSALSQTATKLEKKGLITRERDPYNARNVLLYATDKGRELSIAHKASDIVSVTTNLQGLTRTCTPEEVAHFFKVMEQFIQLLQEDLNS